MFIVIVPLVGQAQPFSLPNVQLQNEERLSQVMRVSVDKIEVRGVSDTTYIDTDGDGESDSRLIDVIEDLTADYTKRRSVTSAELQELRLALSNLYIDSGFVNSGVILPDQTLASGEIFYQAIEGELTRIDIEGNPVISNRYVEKRIARLIGDPLSINDIQYALQYLQNDPNIERLDARLAPGDQLGDSILRLSIEEPTRFELGAEFNNHRATSTGEQQANIILRTRNLTGLGEVATISTGVSEGANNSSVAFALPVSSRNTSLQIYASDSDSSLIEARLKTLDIESLTQTRGLRLSHPFIDTLNRNFSLTLGYESRHSESTLGGLPFSLAAGAQDGVSETNAVMFTGDWTERSSDYVWTARLNFRHGDDYGNATIFDPDTDFGFGFNQDVADGRFDLIQTQVSYLRRVGSEGRVQFAFRASGQFSANPLMSIEKIAIGGVNTVRGYPENFLVRDNGLALSFELRVPIWAESGSTGYKNLTLVPFLDMGRSWDELNTNNISSPRDTSKANTIASAGVSLLWEPLRGLTANLILGEGIHDDLGKGEDPRDFRDSNLQDNGLHFAVAYSFNW
ncbi:MAG: ShlB/FhaC/HecB family hemolysin secretion/activation protein [Pseudohongiellaceae bacterium]